MRLTARAGFAFAAAFLALAGTAEAGLIVRQRANGIPGRGQEEVVPQELRVGERAFRIQDRDRKDARYTIVRLDQEKIYEVDEKLEKYTEQGFDYFRKKRERADQERQATLKAIKDKLEGKEREEALRKHGLREDGKEIVTVEADVPGEVVNGRHTRRTSILVNGRPALVLYTTDEIEKYEPPKVIFDFYDKAQLFSPDVIAELKKVKGFPLKVHANVDFFDASASIQSIVDDVRDWPEDKRAFEVPSYFEKVEEFPKPGADRADLACAVCGAKIPDPAKAETVPGQANVYCCSPDHVKEYLKKHLKR